MEHLRWLLLQSQVFTEKYCRKLERCCSFEDHDQKKHFESTSTIQLIFNFFTNFWFVQKTQRKTDDFTKIFAKAYLQRSQTSKMECFAEIVNV